MMAAELVGRLQGVTKTASGWEARCPAHDDATASLSVAEGRKGIVLHCHAGCTADAVCRALGRSTADLFADNGNGNGKPAHRQITFDWNRCVEAYKSDHCRKLGEWRGLSQKFVKWLHLSHNVGLHDRCVAFPVEKDGKVIACHYRKKDGTWRYEPAGQGTHPFIFGDPKTAVYVSVFESQWDAFAMMDTLDWVSEDLEAKRVSAIIVTRGADNGKSIAGLCSPDALVYAFVQNDKPKAGQTITPAEKWLADVVVHAGCKVLRVTTPAAHKDVNDWTKTGATRQDLELAIRSAKHCCTETKPHSEHASEYLPEASEAQGNGAPLPQIDNAAALLADEKIILPPQIIEGVLHQGLKAVLGSNSKARKTWILLDLATSVATGAPWWNWQTQHGRVLYINFEIPKEFLRSRLQVLCSRKGIVEIGNLDLWNLRGKAAALGRLLPALIPKIEGYRLVIIDPIYKGLGGRDENSAGDVSELCNELEFIAVETGATVFYAAHYAKGNASGKEAIDRIGGSGVWTRDADTIITLTKHKAENAYTVDLILRNLPEQPPFVVKWDFPLMVVAGELDPGELKTAQGRRADHDANDLLAVLQGGGLTTTKWQEKAEEEHGISRRTFYRLKKQLEAGGSVFQLKTDDKWQPIRKA